MVTHKRARTRRMMVGGWLVFRWTGCIWATLVYATNWFILLRMWRIVATLCSRHMLMFVLPRSLGSTSTMRAQQCSPCCHVLHYELGSTSTRDGTKGANGLRTAPKTNQIIHKRKLNWNHTIQPILLSVQTKLTKWCRRPQTKPNLYLKLVLCHIKSIFHIYHMYGSSSTICTK
jgi:hypothetical protein